MMVLQSLAGLPAFLSVFLRVAALLWSLYAVVYTRITPHDEFELIRRNNVRAPPLRSA